MKRNHMLFMIILLLAGTLTLTSCRWDIWGSSPRDYGTGTGSTSSSLLYTGTAPTFVTATQARYSDKIVISWNAVTGADYYEVFRAEIPNLSPAQDQLAWTRMLEAPVGSTSLTDTGIEAGKFYVYRVRARSFALRTLIGNYSQSAYGWVLSPPITFSATQGASSKYIELSWSQVRNIEGYRVYYSVSGYGGTWQVAIPEGYEAYDYVFSPNVLSFKFAPDKALQGQSIYFYIESVSKSGSKSDPSAQRLGYTFVQGAPTAPQNVTASQGESSTEIKLTWKSLYTTDESGVRVDYDWEIYRVADSQSEKKIYSTKDGDPKPTEEGDIMSYTDSNGLAAGIVYTYSIRAIGKIDVEGVPTSVNGLPSSAEGFLLSPPTTVSGVAILPDKSGFTFTIGDAPGVSAHSDWTYSVWGKSAEAGAEFKELDGMNMIPVSDISSRTITTVYNPTDGVPEHAYEYFTVKTSNGYDQSLGYDEVVGTPIQVSRPVSADGFNASDNYVYDGMAASSAGVYPIALTLLTDSSVEAYNVRIWHAKPASTNAAPDQEMSRQAFSILKDAGGNDTNTSIFLNAGTAPIGTQWYFSVQGIDTLGREGEWSDIDAGYGAITGNLLIKQMQVYCLKPWEYIDTAWLTTEYQYSNDINTKWKNSAIYDKIKQAGTGSLSSGITENSYYNNGTIKYVATVQGLGGRVSFTYNKFGEVPYMYSSGSYVMSVSMSGSGSCVGGMTIGGMYPASIGFDNISVSEQKFVGTYTVTQSNGTAAQEVSPDQP